MTDIICDLTDEQIVAALAVEAAAAGAAALLTTWNERVVTSEDVLRRVSASPRLQLVAASCAKAQGRSAGALGGERIRGADREAAGAEIAPRLQLMRSRRGP